MIRINLLPHRQEKRARRQREVTLACFGAVVSGLAVAVLGYWVVSGWVEEQRARNAYLQEQIKELDAEIEKISNVKEKTRDMLARKQIVESLQTNRAEAVHLLDQMVRLMPEGTWLKGIQQAGTLINITGYAQSNARVSTLMRNLDGSSWLERPVLVEIKAATINSKRASEFSLRVNIKRPKVDETSKAGPRTKGQGGKKST